jgi:hypothetical protein
LRILLVAETGGFGIISYGKGRMDSSQQQIR